MLLGSSTRGILVGKFLLGGNVLCVVGLVLLVIGFVLLVVVGLLEVAVCVFGLLFLNVDVLSSLQKSVLQRQAKMDPDPSSVISR